MLTRVAVAIVSLYALYVVGINVFLSTSLFSTVINRQDPDSVFVTFHRGWSVFPGVVHARNLVIRGGDSHVQWLLKIDACEFTMSFYDLAAKKKFHVAQVHGSGVSFVARQRVPSPMLTDEYLAALPEVPGFDRLPIPPAEPPNLGERWDDAQWHLWTVQLENVIAEDVRELWVDTMRFEGSARVTGGFYLKPIRDVRVDSIHVAMSGHATVMRKPILDPFDGSVDLAIASFDPRSVTLADLAHHISGGIDVKGRMPDVAHVPPAFTGPAKLAGAVDLRRVVVGVSRGVLTAGSHIELAAEELTGSVSGHRASAGLSLIADVRAAPGTPNDAELTFRLDTQALTASRGTTDRATVLFTAPRLDITGDSRALDLANPLYDLHVTSSVPRADVPDVRAFAAYLGPHPAILLEGGHARAHARIEAWIEPRLANAEVSMDTSVLDVRLAALHLRGPVRVAASFDGWQWETGRTSAAKATVEVTQATVDLEGSRLAKRASHGARSEPLSIGNLMLTAKSERFAFAAPLAHAVVDATVSGGHVKNASAFDALFEPTSKVRLDTSTSGATFGGELHGVIVDRVAQGSVAVHGHGFGVRAEKVRVNGNIAATARVDAWRIDEGKLRLEEAHVAIDEVALHIGAGNADAPPDATARAFDLRANSKALDLAQPLLKDLDYRLIVSDLVVSDASRLDALMTSDRAGHVPAFAIESGRARASVDLTMTPSKRQASGGVRVALEGAGIRLHQTHITGDFELSADLKGFTNDPAADHAGFIDVSGARNTMRGVRALGAKAVAAQWDGDVTLVQGGLRLAGTPAFDGFVQLHADDANPLLALLLGNSLPTFVVKMLDAPRLSGQARISVEPGRVAIRDARIGGGDVTAFGEYVVLGAHAQGAATVVKGPLSAGVKLDDNGTSVKLGGLDSWAAKERAVVDALWAARARN